MAAQTWLAPVTKLLKSLGQRGWKGTMTQLYTIGDIKFGELKGVDRWGNKYYENIDLPFGQHRWVEYADIHDPDPTYIPPEWHGWMHHVYDETPEETPSLEGVFIPTTEHSHASFNTHVGFIADRSHEKYPTHNTSQYRLRGYKNDSIFTKVGEEEAYYKQPGHPLHPLAEKGGRYTTPKGIEEIDDMELAKKYEEEAERERIEFESYSKN